MLIAFEGPDNTGKSTSAANLAFDGQPIYNATKGNYAAAQADLVHEPELVHTFDRIDWFSHMVYRLALPGHEWNDDRPRTVFAMPDTHLVVKLHHPKLALSIEDELYGTGTVALVNPVYYYFTDFFTELNEQQDYALWRSVSVMEVSNDPVLGTFEQRLVMFSSPALSWEFADKLDITTDEMLLELLRYDEQQSL